MGQRFMFTFVALVAGLGWYLVLQTRQTRSNAEEEKVEPAFFGWAI